MDYSDDEDKEKVKNSASALVKYDSEIYWVPIGTDAYKEIDIWGHFGAPEAGDLKSSKTLMADVKTFLKGERHRVWDYKEILIILAAAGTGNT